MAELTTKQCLGKVPLFKDLDEKHLERISQLATRLDLPAGKELTHEGATGHEFVVVLKGDVEIRHEGEVVATAGPGDFIGEIALLSDRPRTATAVTKSPVVIEVIGRREFLDMLDNEPEVASKLQTAMDARLKELDAS